MSDVIRGTVCLLAGVAAGAFLHHLLTQKKPAPVPIVELDLSAVEALRARTASAVAEVKRLGDELVVSERARREAVEAARRPIPPAVRARRVAEAIQVPAGDVVPMPIGPRSGFWVAEHVLVELEAAKTASDALGRDRLRAGALLAAQEKVLGMRALELRLMEEQRDRYRVALVATEQRNWVLAARIGELENPPVWRQPLVLILGGIAIGLVGGFAVDAALSR